MESQKNDAWRRKIGPKFLRRKAVRLNRTVDKHKQCRMVFFRARREDVAIIKLGKDEGWS